MSELGYPAASMSKDALIVWGGWDGHEPELVADFFRQMLESEGFEVHVSGTLDSFTDTDLSKLSLIVPVITMSSISSDQLLAVTSAVAKGVGMGGCHGGMCDSFRADTEWHFMTGGQWVSHPGDDGIRYTVCLNAQHPHSITEGLSDFEVESEQYYLHTDPGNTVLAYTEFPHKEVGGLHEQNPCNMPQVWVKHYGKGRVFYNALGHNRKVLEGATAAELMRRGFLWAAR